MPYHWEENVSGKDDLLVPVDFIGFGWRWSFGSFSIYFHSDERRI